MLDDLFHDIFTGKKPVQLVYRMGDISLCIRFLDPMSLQDDCGSDFFQLGGDLLGLFLS